MKRRRKLVRARRSRVRVGDLEGQYTYTHYSIGGGLRCYNRYMKKLSARGWLTIITLVLLLVVVTAAWPQILKAWALMGSVNPWILALLVPIQFLSYYATGGIIFSYLRSKGNLKDISHGRMTRIALELNFVNHVFPSGGAAGFSYLAWVLKKHQVSVSRSTMSQIIRFVLTFISFIVLLVVSMIILAFRHRIDSATVLIGAVLIVGAIAATWLAIWLVKSLPRLRKFSAWVTRVGNKIISAATFRRVQNKIKYETIYEFFDDIHDDYMGLRRERKVLLVPFLWALLANALDVALIWIAFWSLGFPLDASLLFIAFGVASIASAFAVTPGGTGVYETIMVAFLAASGVTPEVAIAGTLLARVTLLAGTVLFGYVLYQLTVVKYGKRPVKS